MGNLFKLIHIAVILICAPPLLLFQRNSITLKLEGSISQGRVEEGEEQERARKSKAGVKGEEVEEEGVERVRESKAGVEGRPSLTCMCTYI